MKKDTKQVVWGIVAGSVLGSVTALLLAPKSGKELRKDIADGTSAAIGKAQNLAGQAGELGADWIGKAKTAAGNTVRSVREWRTGTVGELAEGAGEVLADAGEALEQTAEALAEAAEAAKPADGEAVRPVQ